MVDLLFFVIILSLTIISFGVVTQTLLNPEAKLEIDLLQNITRRPYFQMYGELFLEDYAGKYNWLYIACTPYDYDYGYFGSLS